MSASAAVYRRADRHDAWAAWQERQREFQHGLDAFIAKVLPGSKAMLGSYGVGGRRLGGITLEGDEIPAGWKYDKKQYCLVPLRGKMPKALLAEFDALRCDGPTEAIAPLTSAWFGLSLRSPAVQEIGPYLYVYYGKPIHQDAHDEAVADGWQPVKLSTYIALLEDLGEDVDVDG